METKPTMFSYIQSEQAVLLAALNQYPKNIDASLAETPTNLNDLLILATGSSINAALSAKHYIETKANIKIDIQEPYNYLHYGAFKPTNQIVLGISQSGQSTSTIDTLNDLSDTNIKIAVTSIPDSEITQVATTTLDILSGRERVGYVTLGFSATVLALMLFGLRLGVKKGLISPEQERAELAEFKDILSAIDDTIDKSIAFYKNNENDLITATRFMTIAYGSAFGTAKEMETKFSETVRIPSSGIDLEAFMHGPYLEMQKDYRLFFLDIPAKELIREKARLLKQYEDKVTPYTYLISVTKEQAESKQELVLHTISDQHKAPLLLMIPFQVFSWFVSRGRGIDITQRIYTDFAQSVKSKTTVQDYV
jgi:Glucosamine 6-phosphate synthetase, contains amidotransferase and phosphosugar isomerase domains